MKHATLISLVAFVACGSAYSERSEQSTRSNQSLLSCTTAADCSTNNVPFPTCTAGVCTGHCADGFVDCNNDRQTDGCEKATSCGNCCGAVCSAGQLCYDTGSKGVCQSTITETEACSQAVENSFTNASCPLGQHITHVTFADYGEASGTCGQSFLSACSNVFQPTLAHCSATPGCSFNRASGTCVPTSCFNLTQAACVADSSCLWNSHIVSCVGSSGLTHDYGTPPTDTVGNGFCGLDVSAISTVTTACGVSSARHVGGCGVDAENDNWPAGGFKPVIGYTLPLSSSITWFDPCPANQNKKLSMQVACSTCGSVSKRIFVTQMQTTGYINFNGIYGIDGADEICAYEAEASGLSGRYHAWLSAGVITPDDPIRQTENNSYYVLVDNTRVANKFVNGLVGNGNPNHFSPIYGTACQGQTACVTAGGEGHVWTGTLRNGTRAATNCQDWQSGAATDTGEVGDYTSANVITWTASGTMTCDRMAALYCIEQ